MSVVSTRSARVGGPFGLGTRLGAGNRLARRKSVDLDRLVTRMVRNEHVTGLIELILDEQTPAAYRRQALEGLIEVGNQEAWDGLCNLVVSNDGHVVELIIQTLAQSSAPQALRALGECLSNESPFVRSEAVRAIDLHHGAQTLTLLLRASRDPQPSVGRMAARALTRKLEQRPAVLSEIRESTAEGIMEILDVRWAMEYLADVYPTKLRVIAARRLGQIGGEEATTALVSIIEAIRGPVQDACWSALQSCGSVSEHHLFPLFANPDGSVRARAITVYGRFADEHAAGLLQGFAGDADPDVRIASLTALARVTEAGASTSLEAALEDPEPRVRMHAVELLCTMPDSAHALIGVVNREKGDMRRKALTALANWNIVTPELVMAYLEYLLQGANVTDVSDREYLDGLGAAARALGSQRVPEGLIALTALVRSVVKRLRRIAIEGIMSYPIEERSDALFALVDTYDMDVLKNVAFGLHDSQDARALVPLIRTSYECKGRPQIRAQKVLKEYDQCSDLTFLVELLSNRWPSVRRFGAERLKAIHDPRSIPPLLEASRDEDVEVQLAVFEALGPFATESQDVIKRMLEAISLGDISVRQMACEALGEARVKEAVPDLVKALYNFFLRPRAGEALKRIGDRKGILAMKRIERREKLFPKKPKEALEAERRKHRASIDA